MSFGLKRSDLRAIAQGKLDDAVHLLGSARYSNSYYLAGYSVEIGLKACIARLMLADVIPDRKLIEGTYQHNFDRLVAQAGLMADLRAEIDGNPDFAVNWGIAGRWDPSARYDSFTANSAQLLVQAIGQPKVGVFEWIKANW